jgi:hypothetical protein
LDVVEAGPRDQDKEFLDRSIAYRKTSDGLPAAMNHDITAEGREVAPIQTSTLDIGGIWVVHTQGQMKSAIRIEEFDAIKSFGNLLVALAKLRAGRSACGQDGIRQNEARRPVSVVRYRSSSYFSSFKASNVRFCGGKGNPARWKVGRSRRSTDGPTTERTCSIVLGFEGSEEGRRSCR